MRSSTDTHSVEDVAATGRAGAAASTGDACPFAPMDFGPNGEQVAAWLIGLDSVTDEYLEAFTGTFVRRSVVPTDPPEDEEPEDEDSDNLRRVVNAFRDLVDALDAADGYGYAGGMNSAASYATRRAFRAPYSEAHALAHSLSLGAMAQLLVLRWELNPEDFELLTQPWVELFGPLPEPEAESTGEEL